jgi:hypothetical protein
MRRLIQARTELKAFGGRPSRKAFLFSGPR